MSLFQCENCGCCENTALSAHLCKDMPNIFDWAWIEDRRGKRLCSSCGPTKYSDGTPTEYGEWHGRFDLVYLPMGMFKTARNGNLAHVETGDEDYRKRAIPNAAVSRPREAD